MVARQLLCSSHLDNWSSLYYKMRDAAVDTLSQLAFQDALHSSSLSLFLPFAQVVGRTLPPSMDSLICFLNGAYYLPGTLLGAGSIVVGL